MNSKIKVLLIALLVVVFSVTGTYCIYVDSYSDSSYVYVEERSTTLLDNAAFLAKVQALDPTITSIDKTTDLHRVTTVPNVTLRDANKVSKSVSNEVPTYLWIDNGVIYYFTIADNINLNDN